MLGVKDAQETLCVCGCVCVCVCVCVSACACVKTVSGQASSDQEKAKDWHGSNGSHVRLTRSKPYLLCNRAGPT